MNTITVDKAKLIETLKTNRDEHRAIFDKAMEVYADKMIEELERRVREIKAKSKIRRGFSLPEPEDHTADFDTAIQMLEWDTGDEVELSFGEFQQYVQNEWRWQQSFAANTASYSIPG